VDNDFELNDSEKSLIKTVAEAFRAVGKRLSWSERRRRNRDRELEGYPGCDPARMAGRPGDRELDCRCAQRQGQSIGKLASTFPMRYQDVPSARNFPGVVLEKAKPEAKVEDEDLMSVFRRRKHPGSFMKKGSMSGTAITSPSG